MLKKFSVTNFRQFNDTLEFDLTSSNYAFNQGCVKDGIVKFALIYGENGTGKTNLGKAIFDSVSHLTDFTSMKSEKYFLNANSNKPTALFRFEFLFKERKKTHEVIYEYEKDDKEILISEKIYINNELVLDYKVGNTLMLILKGTEQLNKTINPSQNLSAVKYVYSNTSLTSNLDKRNLNNRMFLAFFEQIKAMLLFRNVFDGIHYIGQHNGGINILESIIDNGNIKDFEKFLNEFGLNFKLVTIRSLEEKSIGIKFGKKVIPFFKVISTGTKSLTLFYYWWQIIKIENKVSLLFIDEFDASYHFALSEKIVEKLKQLADVQVILTTHNTNLLSNELIRPDCAYVIDGKKISSLKKATNKELREIHNLERLYQAGEFDEE